MGAVADAFAPPPGAPRSPGPRCFDPGAFAPLARLPPGLVLASPDFGPYVLAFTHHGVVTAPYHRLWREILAAHQAFNASPVRAQARVRGLGARYVIDCPPYPMFLDQGSFGARLRASPAPSWLTRLSPPGATLAVYEVTNAGRPSVR
jgi:hypothetical protein